MNVTVSLLLNQLEEEISLVKRQIATSQSAISSSLRAQIQRPQLQLPVQKKTTPLPQHCHAEDSMISPCSTDPSPHNRTNCSPPAAPPTSSATKTIAAATTKGELEQAPLETERRGPLLLLVRRRGPLGGTAFIPHWFVVSETGGIQWFGPLKKGEEVRDECRGDLHHVKKSSSKSSSSKYFTREELETPQHLVGKIPFWVETLNSRGSRFKKAAVCWPLILPEDCAEATDPAIYYFGIDYYSPSAQRELMVIGARSSAERDAWVKFLRRYIKLYLAPRAESEELQHLCQGAAAPMHESRCVDGEAPGGTIR